MEANAILELYERADSFAREVGNFRDDVAIPANNELRYAGHHFLKAYAGETVDSDEADGARRHCERAMYEAAEAGIQRVVREMRRFQDDYEGLVISEVIPDFAVRMVAAEEALDALSQGRSERTSVEEHAAEYMEMFRGLRASYNLFNASRSDLNAIVRADRATTRRFLITIAVSLAAVCTGTAIAIAQYLP